MLSIFRDSLLGLQVGRYLLDELDLDSLLVLSASQSRECTDRLFEGRVSAWSTLLPPRGECWTVWEICCGLLWIILLTVSLNSLSLLVLLDGLGAVLGACFSFKVSPAVYRDSKSQKNHFRLNQQHYVQHLHADSVLFCFLLFKPQQIRKPPTNTLQTNKQTKKKAETGKIQMKM